jgi:hypothetical protein
MENLVELIGKQITPEVLNALGGASGTNATQAQSALTAAIPAIVGGLAKQGASPAGAQKILDLLGQQKGGADLLSNFTSLLGNATTSQNLTQAGGNILNGLFAGDTDKVINAVAATAGIKNEAATSLMKSVAPMGLAVLGKVISGGKLDASGLSNLLAGQADFVKAAAPKQLTDALGVSNFTSAPATTRAAAVPPPPVQAPPPAPKRSMNWLWWLLGLLALLAILGFLFFRPQPQTANQLPAEVQAPVCAAIKNLEQTIAALPNVTAETTVNDLQASRDQVKTAFDGVVSALQSVRPEETKALQAAYATYDSAVSGITGTDTVGAAAEGVLTARKAVADAQANLLRGFSCQ